MPRSRFVASVILALGLVVHGPASAAGDFEGGVKAYQRGDFEEALRQWLPLAQEGMPFVQVLVGSLYAFGQGVERDDAAAVQWYRRAAMQGSAQGQFNLAVMYENGWGIPADADKARYWYTEAARQGREDARERLAALTSPPPEAEPPAVSSPKPSDDAARRNEPAAAPSPAPVEAAARSDAAPPPPAADAPVARRRREPSQVSAADHEPVRTATPVARVQQRAASPGSEPVRTAAAAIPAGGTWLERQRPAHYTIQLGADEDRTVLQQRARALGLDKDYAIFRSERNGRALYALIYGAFTTPTQAGSAIDDMPDDWKRDNPWIRDFRGIRRAAGQSSR